MSEHRSIMEKLTRLRDQLPTGQLVIERAQEILQTFNSQWYGKFLDILESGKEQQDLLQLVEDYANGQQFNEALLHEVTKLLMAEEQRLETCRFWMEAGNWSNAVKAIGGTEAEVKAKFPSLVRAHRDVELQVELLNAKAMDLCQQTRSSPAQEKQQQQEIPPEAEQLPEKYQKDKRRYKTGWGI